MGEVASRFPGEFPDREREVLAICAVGARSQRVAQSLRALGYARTVNVAGGFNQWRALGLPFEPRARWTPTRASATADTCCCRRSANRASSAWPGPAC
jgi:3-mercaptopyruvate sulfurtransferase SseA